MTDRKLRFGKRARLLCETLEQRNMLDVSFGWEVSGGSLYYRIDGDATPNDVVIYNFGIGSDTFFEISYVDGDGDTQFTGGSVSAGEIAQQQSDSGKPFAGFHIVLGAGDDSVLADFLKYHATWIEAGAGDDDIGGSQRNDKIDGGDGNNTIFGNTGADSITTGNGADIVSGGAGSDVIDTGLNNDLVSGDAGNDKITLGPPALPAHGPAPVLPFPSEFYDDDTATGGAGNDTIVGGGGFDSISGNAGSDDLSGGAQGDWINADYFDSAIDGGTGGEETTIRDFSAGKEATVIPENAPNGTFNDGDVLSFSSLAGTSATDVGALQNPYLNNTFEVIIGSTGNDHIDSTGFIAGGDFAGAGVNAALGTGDDTFQGSAKNDTVNGGGGSDTISYAKAAMAVTVNLTGPQSSTGGDTGTDGLSSIENVIGGTAGDTVFGSAAGNKIDGRGGNDSIYGLAGADILGGGAGDDYIDGGTENDTVDGGAGNDDVNGGGGDDTVRLNFADLNLADNFRGGAGADRYKFYNVPFDDGPNNVFDDPAGEIAGDDSVAPATVSAMFKYLDDIADLSQGDWDPTQDVLDGPNRLGLPPIFTVG